MHVTDWGASGQQLATPQCSVPDGDVYVDFTAVSMQYYPCVTRAQAACLSRLMSVNV